jgi:hypothetical protein
MSDAIDPPEATHLRSIAQIQREERLNYPKAKRARDQELAILKIRSLIADKEMIVEMAKRDNARDGWLCDYHAWSKEIDAEIQSLFILANA